jgi:protein-tyrosine phosphatase
MDEIRSWLYIGNYRDTQDKERLDFNSVQAVLQLATPVNHTGITSLYLPVKDMSPIHPHFFKEGVEFVRGEKEKGRKILVACAAGVNRSTAFCLASLKEIEGLSLLDAFKEVKRNHSRSMPQEMVWESLCNYYNEKTSYLDLLRTSAQYY